MSTHRDDSVPITRETPDIASSSEDYAQRFAGRVGCYFVKVQLDVVQTFLPPATECRVLDVGGGHAQLTPPLLAAGYDVTVFGSDDSCRERLERIVDAAQLRFVSGNLLQLPFESDSFDVVLAFRLLPHLNNWKRFLSELCRVANGAIILDYPDLRSINWFSNSLFAVKKRIENNTRTYRCFHQREVTNELSRNGFDLQRAHRQFLLPMALHRLLGWPTFSKTSEGFARSVGLTQLLGSPVILRAIRKV